MRKGAQRRSEPLRMRAARLGLCVGEVNSEAPREHESTTCKRCKTERCQATLARRVIDAREIENPAASARFGR